MTDIVGQKITGIRAMTKAELAAEGWEFGHDNPPVLVLENGTCLYPSRDQEGNGGGAMFGKSKTRGQIMVMAP